MYLNKTCLKNSRILENTLRFIYCNNIENFWEFPSCKSQDFFFFYLRQLEISEVTKFLILALILKWKTQKTRKYFQDLWISKNALYLKKLRIYKVSEFSVAVLLLLLLLLLLLNRASLICTKHLFQNNLHC